VDQESRGKLSKEQFIVGMWLIDQSLGGRKLPLNSVPSEAWRSAQHLTSFFKQ